jgi:hypothetical protein
MKTDKKELENLVSLFLHRKLFTNDSIIMLGDLEKLKKLIDKFFNNVEDFECYLINILDNEQLTDTEKIKLIRKYI